MVDLMSVGPVLIEVVVVVMVIGVKRVMVIVVVVVVTAVFAIAVTVLVAKRCRAPALPTKVLVVVAQEVVALVVVMLGWLVMVVEETQQRRTRGLKGRRGVLLGTGGDSTGLFSLPSPPLPFLLLELREVGRPLFYSVVLLRLVLIL